MDLHTGDLGTGAFVITILTMIFREIRWHRIHGKVKKERDELHNSLHPPKIKIIPPAMPPWNEKEDEE